VRVVTGAGAASYTVTLTRELHFASEPADVTDSKHTHDHTPSSAPRIDRRMLPPSAAPILSSTAVAAHVVTPAISAATTPIPPLPPTHSQLPL